MSDRPKRKRNEEMHGLIEKVKSLKVENARLRAVLEGFSDGPKPYTLSEFRVKAKQALSHADTSHNISSADVTDGEKP